MVFYPAILFPPGEDGLAGCVIPGININAGGPTSEAALNDAVEVLEAVLAEAAETGEQGPAPLSIEDVQREIDELGGSLVWLPALAPQAAA